MAPRQGSSAGTGSATTSTARVTPAISRPSQSSTAYVTTASAPAAGRTLPQSERCAGGLSTSTPARPFSKSSTTFHLRSRSVISSRV